MKTSLIITTLNEQNTVADFIKSAVEQTVLPTELIIIDGGSADTTLEKIISSAQKYKKLSIIYSIKKGNRSVGRNEGVKLSHYDILLFSDAGCILDKNWVEEITRPLTDKTIDVIAGYYAARSHTVFQECLAPYVLVMPDKVDPRNFLPATRSMAIRKSVFADMGGFDAKYSHNEDYVFARRLRSEKKNIFFARDAIVYWIPRPTIKQAYVMFWRFALGDMEAGIVRPKVLFLFVRYLLAFLLIGLFLLTQNKLLVGVLLLSLVIYIVWTIKKNYQYIKKLQAFYLLPLVQFTADIAVMIGSIQGVVSRYGI